MATSILEDRSCRHLSSVPDLPDELVQEILTRLPVKSLMRFKCVSKLWQSIILNPSFASAYRGGFRGVLIDEAPFRWFSPTKDFFYLNLFDDDDDNDETVNDDNGLKSWTDDEIFDDDDGFNCKSSSVKYLCHSHTVDYGSGRELGSTDIVNGLVCFYIGNYSCLYNIATRETMELPLSQNDNKCCSYHLGFDPVNKLYKLLKIRPIYDEEDEYFNEQLINATWIRNLDSEILTLGIDRSWRHIDAAPREIVGRSVCFNGVVYWQDLTILPTYDDAGIIAFHLAQEKFEFISTPNNTYCLPRFAPGLALMAASSNGEVDIIGYGKGVGWCDQKKFKLPWKDASDIYPQGIFPDGKVLILDDDSFEGMYCPSRCYLYDPMEKKSTRVVICKSLSSPSNEFERYIDGYMSYFEENIIPLSCLSTATSSTTAPKLN